MSEKELEQSLKAVSLESSPAKEEESGQNYLEANQSKKQSICVESLTLQPSIQTPSAELSLFSYVEQPYKIAREQSYIERDRRTLPSAAEIGLLNQAKLLKEEGKRQEEERCYIQVIEINNSNLRAWELLGHLQFDQARWDEAATSYQRTVRLERTHSRGLYNWGTALNQAQRWQEAIPVFERYLLLRPEDHEGYNNLGDAMIHTNRKKEGTQHFLKAAELFPSDPHAYNNLGNLHLYEDPPAAVRYYRKGISADPTYSENYNGLGVAFNSLKQYAKAIDIFKKAIELKSTDPDYFHNMAVAQKHLGNEQQAIRYHELALEVDPDYELSFTGLAAIHHEAGRLKEAISCYQRAIQAHPEYENAHYNLGVLYETTGKWNEAIACFENYLKIRVEEQVLKKVSDIYKLKGDLQAAAKYAALAQAERTKQN